MADTYKERELVEALEALLDLITSGRHYQSQNPYTRPEVEQAYRALGRDWRSWEGAHGHSRKR